MPGSTSDSYEGPPICRCNHFKWVHGSNGCEAPDCQCPQFEEIPLEESELGQAMDAFLGIRRKGTGRSHDRQR